AYHVSLSLSAYKMNLNLKALYRKKCCCLTTVGQHHCGRPAAALHARVRTFHGNRQRPGVGLRTGDFCFIIETGSSVIAPEKRKVCDDAFPRCHRDQLEQAGREAGAFVQLTTVKHRYQA
ncbi:hypothetical protein OW909_25970, partial [Klebsiella pneumoniae]